MYTIGDEVRFNTKTGSYRGKISRIRFNFLVVFKRREPLYIVRVPLDDGFVEYKVKEKDIIAKL